MKSVFKLDPASDRYRVCPNCQTPHMVKHLGRDFCSDNCADTYYNKKRRLKKQAEEMIAGKKEVIVEAAQMSLGGPVELLQETDPNWSENTKANLAILDGLVLDEKHGSTFWIEDLFQNGFNFECYSTLGKLHNLPAGVHCAFLIYKNYRVYRVDYDKVLIKKF